MGPEEFNLCSWYDTTLWVEHIEYKRNVRKDDHDFVKDLFRSSLCYYFNWNSPTTKIEPQDIWPLSHEDKAVPDMDKEKERSTIERLERIAKNRKKRG